jgi:hypothetical protein
MVLIYIKNRLKLEESIDKNQLFKFQKHCELCHEHFTSYTPLKIYCDYCKFKLNKIK